MSPAHTVRVLVVTALFALAAPRLAAQQPGVPINPELLSRQWPASWIAAPGAPERDAGVYHFRRFVPLDSVPARLLVHVSGDQRYLLHVNGHRVGAGPGRGDPGHWRFETYDLALWLKPGVNVVAATVWNFGLAAPMAQMTRRTGFLLQADDPACAAFNTGRDWQAQVATGHGVLADGLAALRARGFYYAAGPGERRDGRLWDWAWDTTDSAPARWVAAKEIWRGHPRSISVGPAWMLSPEGWLLVPNPLPLLRHDVTEPGRVARTTLAGVAQGQALTDVTVPARSDVRMLIDRATLTSAYPTIVVSGGLDARVRVTYAEALFDADRRKGDRNQLAGKDIVGVTDEFIADGGTNRRFEPLWFRTWRFLELHVTTADQPLTIDRVDARFTGFPLELIAGFDAGDDALRRIWDISWRTVQLAAHETYVDAPYWEQLQYVGDTRVDALLSYALANDDRLARQAIEQFDDSRSAEGLTQSRYPTLEPQYIPPYSLFFVGMVHDFWMYRADRAFVAARLPGTRAVLDWYLARQRGDGLLGHLPYWVHGDTGTALDDAIQDKDGGSALITLQLLMALRDAAAIEHAMGDAWRAQRYLDAAGRAANAVAALWDPDTGLVADTPAKLTWGHPVNIVAVMASVLPADRQAALVDRVIAIGRHPAGRGADGGRGGAWPIDAIPSATFYFRFYLARALEAAGRGDAYLDLLQPWRDLLGQGLTTWPEHPDPSRSDCHAWSAHPALDLLRVVAGVRPDAPGFARVRIVPSPGSLKTLSAVHPHPKGEIRVAYDISGSTLTASVALPAGVEGVLVWNRREYPLHGGAQTLVAR
ncbi:MAG: alpha-L-rhamnosidase [Vicinamibacteria bacterium]|nr:alpha-L-rhamnosidase [Vicinamibacteria bacterium]